MMSTAAEADLDLYNPACDAIGINVLFGFLDVQPWASEADCRRAGRLLAELGAESLDHTVLDNGVTRYRFPVDESLWEHVVHI